MDQHFNFRGKRILVVEDDFSSRLYLSKILEMKGIEVIHAANGREAFETMKKDPDIDLILMDLQLPVVDGYECTTMLREAGFMTVIIAQTAYGLSSDKERIMASGFNDYLIKPISQSQLFDKLKMFLA